MEVRDSWGLIRMSLERAMSEFACGGPKFDAMCDGSSDSLHCAVALKAFLFFIRSYQDVLACGFRHLQRQKFGGFTSMAQCLGVTREKKPLSVVLDQILPEYQQWFNYHKRQLFFM